MTALTADLCARAVIASARVYGDDPVLACMGRRGPSKRCLAPVVLALAGVLKIELRRAARPFKVEASNLRRAEAMGGALFKEAQAAAEGTILGWIEPLEAMGGGEPVAAAPSESTQPIGLKPATSVAPAAKTALALPAMKALGRVKREILAVLAEDPSSGPELMQLVGVGEGQIREALSALKEEGAVRCDALTQEGWSAQFWRLAEGAKA